MRQLLRHLLLPAIGAFKACLIPFLTIQISAVILVVAYFQFPAVKRAADQIGSLKAQTGLWFSFVGYAVLCALLPEFVRLILGQLKRVDLEWLGARAYVGFVYGLLGVFTDVFYGFLARTVGTDNAIGTMLQKSAVDMLGATPLVFVPASMWLLGWRAASWDFRALLKPATGKFWLDEVVPGVGVAWSYWFPLTFCIYALPSALQLPFAMLCAAAYSLLFVTLAGRIHSATEVD